LPGGQIVPTPRRSILHPSRASELPYLKNMFFEGGGGAFINRGWGLLSMPTNKVQGLEEPSAPMLGVRYARCAKRAVSDMLAWG
jgi:hypothetical protein